MKEYSIAVIPGDGIGNEVMPEGLKVLEAVGEVFGEFRFRFEHFPSFLYHPDHYEYGGYLADAEILSLCSGQ